MVIAMDEYELVIFDVDGTLLDTSEGILASAIYTIENFGYEVPSKEILRTYIGPPIQKSFANSLCVSEEIANKMADCFRNRYKDIDLLKAECYEGILNVFQQLNENGFKLAIATYKRQDYAEKIVDHFGFTKYTSMVFGSDFEGNFSKADIIRNAIVASKITNHKKVVMVGDTENDAIGAAELGIDFIGVTFGFGYQKEDDVIGKNIIGIANKPKDIFNIVKRSKHEN